MIEATAGARYPATGTSAGRSACRTITVRSGKPLAMAVRTKRLRSTSSMLAAGEPRDVRKRRQRQCDHRQHQMPDRAGLPAGDRQPVQINAEQQRRETAAPRTRESRCPTTASDIVA